MLFLGFGCGLPFLLLTSVTLNTWLREAGLSLSSIGLISFASFAYVLKPLWAPLLDRHSAPVLAGLGRRRSWILLSQCILAIALLAMANTNPAAATTSFVLLICIGALAGATQDTVVDAYRIEIAPIEAQAALAATYSLLSHCAVCLGRWRPVSRRVPELACRLPDHGGADAGADYGGDALE